MGKMPMLHTPVRACYDSLVRIGRHDVPCVNGLGLGGGALGVQADARGTLGGIDMPAQGLAAFVGEDLDDGAVHEHAKLQRFAAASFIGADSSDFFRWLWPVRFVSILSLPWVTS